MQLSPLTKIGVVQTFRKTEQEASTTARLRGHNTAERVVMYRCPICDELHDDEFDAEECCPLPKQTDGIHANKCPVCGETYNSARDAADCCLWKDLDAPTRWALADRVEAGNEWSRELDLMVLA